VEPVGSSGGRRERGNRMKKRAGNGRVLVKGVSDATPSHERRLGSIERSLQGRKN